MRISLNKKSISISTLVVLLASFLLIPMVHAGNPGQNYSSAPLKIPGNYSETMPTGWAEGLYNVTGKVGYNLTVKIEFLVLHGFDLELRAPDGTVLDTDPWGSGEYEEIVTTICDSNLNYTIYLLRQYGSGDADYNLIITLTGSDGIPGFEIFLVFCSFIILLGSVVFLNRRQLILNQ